MKANFSKSKVIILCGGRGKRLGDLTKKIPKPLLKVGKISIIDLPKNKNKIIIVETLQIAKNSIISLGVPAIIEFSTFASASFSVFL